MHSTQIRSVLAATDLTSASDDVLRAAAALARAARAALHVIHAFDLDLAVYGGIDGGVPTFQGRIARAEETLERKLHRVLASGTQADTREVVIHIAHRAILDRAARIQADVIVLGPHRGRAHTGRLLGTTADHVIRSAACPVLVVHGPLTLPLRRVVVPLDLSDPARGALGTAADWVEVFGARTAGLELPSVELDVVHVVPEVFATRDLPVNRAIIGPRLHEQAEEILARTGAGVAVREELAWGDAPAEEIVRYAGEREAELVVLATHGHGALKRALVGSVASAVARDAPCAVLLVPPSRWNGGADEATPLRAVSST